MLIKFLGNCFIFTFIFVFILILILISIFIIIKIKIKIMIVIMIIIFVMIIVMIMIIVTIHVIKMETIFMNTKNSKTNESHRSRLDLTDKLNLKNPKKKYGFS